MWPVTKAHCRAAMRPLLMYPCLLGKPGKQAPSWQTCQGSQSKRCSGHQWCKCQVSDLSWSSLPVCGCCMVPMHDLAELLTGACCKSVPASGTARCAADHSIEFCSTLLAVLELIALADKEQQTVLYNRLYMCVTSVLRLQVLSPRLLLRAVQWLLL